MDNEKGRRREAFRGRAVRNDTPSGVVFGLAAVRAEQTRGTH